MIHARARDIIRAAAEQTASGKRIDDHQILARTIAQLATHLEALNNLDAVGSRDPYLESIRPAATTALTRTIEELACAAAADLNTEIEPKSTSPLASREYEKIGMAMLESDGVYSSPIVGTDGVDDDAMALRESTRRFARTTIAPHAEEVHRNDLLVPEQFIREMAELGYFGMSVPEEYGGVGLSNLMMVIATEELSCASLATAGSLITRPEILTKALLAGGTDEQKSQWLPKVASGELMVAIAVTEPNTGSDVASLTCRAERDEVDGEGVYRINGSKAWCTFAGRADILALLARTDPDPDAGHTGLSLLIVEKDRFDGHDFVMTQPGGGTLTAKADATLGYRGMHSFTMQFEDYVVPARNVVGGDAGLGRGFYLQMGGFAAGRLQTGGRAIGLAQAALEAAIEYAKGRPQFGLALAEFQNTQFEIGRMAVAIETARQLTYRAARSTDESSEKAVVLAAMAKLYASRVAVDVTQRAQLLHGGWGYAEEYAISRYVVDALVLPIFEGVEPILEMKVIARAILANPDLLG